MELIGFNGDILMGVTQPSLSAASLQTNIIPNSYGLSIQLNSNSQIASIQFDAATGWLAIAGNANNNIVKQTITGNGYSNSILMASYLVAIAVPHHFGKA